MTDEWFDVVDESDAVLYSAPRTEVHARRWLHRAAHIFVFNSRGELLVHRRSATKNEYPLRYNSSASGHLHAGEDYAPAAVRELEEELGLTGDLEFLHKFPASAETSYEHTVLYRMTTDATPRFDPEEIESGAYYSLRALLDWIARRPDDFTPCFLTLFGWYLAQFPLADGPLP
ncbi:MAG: NUDIX domain-containing protein [Planctomycetaceae bacterium]|nr:NUDIX domain-containing protein [Planctomycetaceae bacterium]